MTPLKAAESLVTAFASSDRTAYFSHFSPEATFIFHTEPKRLESRREYEDLWDSWEVENSFRVVGCTSSNGRVQELGDMAIFTHDVETTVSTDGGQETTHERETIVFQRHGGGWSAVHEHLSIGS